MDHPEDRPAESPLSVLVVDDDADLRALIEKRLKRCGFAPSGVGTGQEAIAYANDHQGCLLLLDHRLPDLSGREVAERLAGRTPRHPFIMMTGQGDERLAVEMMKLGAADYLIKDVEMLDRLPGVIERVFRAQEMERRLAEAERDKELLREQLLQSRKMEAVGQLASGVAHDFNNMLGAIVGAAEMLVQSGVSGGEATSYLSAIIDTAFRAADITAKLLTFSRKESIEFMPLDLNALLRETGDLLGHTLNKKIVLIFDLLAQPATILGGASALQNAFLNLGINAGHAMPGGGTLRFATRIVTLDEAQCRSLPMKVAPGAYIAASVSDTGCGIPAEHLDRIFEPFFTTKEAGQGTGLGLATVFGTVMAHRGAITVASEPGEGSMFTIHIPLAPAVERNAHPETFPEHRGSGTILLADDEELFRAISTAMVRSFGYQVITAADGREAVARYKENMPDIAAAILDLIMPGLDGLEAYREIKRMDPQARILLCSGYAQEEVLGQLKLAGDPLFLKKPFHKSELGALLEQLLEPRSGA